MQKKWSVLFAALAGTGLLACGGAAMAGPPSAAPKAASARAAAVRLFRQIVDLRLSPQQEHSIADRLVAVDRAESGVRETEDGAAAPVQDALKRAHDALLAGGAASEQPAVAPDIREREAVDARMARGRSLAASAIAAELTLPQLDVIREETGTPARTISAPGGAAATGARDPMGWSALRALTGPLLGCSELEMLRDYAPDGFDELALNRADDDAAELRGESGISGRQVVTGPGFSRLSGEILTMERSVRGTSELEFKQSLSGLVDADLALRSPLSAAEAPGPPPDTGNTLDELACRRFFFRPAALSYLRRFSLDDSSSRSAGASSPKEADQSEAARLSGEVVQFEQILSLKLRPADLSAITIQLSALDAARIKQAAIDNQAAAPVQAALDRIHAAFLRTAANPDRADIALVDAAMGPARRDRAAFARQRHDVLDAIRWRLNRAQLDALRVAAGLAPAQPVNTAAPNEPGGGAFGAQPGASPPQITGPELLARIEDFGFLAAYRRDSTDFDRDKYADTQFTTAYCSIMGIEGDPQRYEEIRSRIAEGCHAVSQISDAQFQELRVNILGSVMNQMGLHLSPDPDVLTADEIDDEAIADLILKPETLAFLKNRAPAGTSSPAPPRNGKGSL